MSKLEILTDFPTGKPHVSFSEVKNWKECSWRHKLMYIDNLSTDSTNPYAPFGSAVHAACENYLETREMDLSIAESMIRESWREMNLEEIWHTFPSYVLKIPASVEHWVQMSRDILSDVPDFLDKKFPGWECVKAEEELYESIEDHEVKFKGFIDAIIKAPTKTGKTKYWILDWKTAGWGWTRQKKQDPAVQMQIVLYKSYWARKANISPKDLKTGFVLLKRDGKNGSRCELVQVSSGPTVQERSNKIVDSMIRSVKKGVAIKNRFSCKFCEFHGTEHCP